MTTKKATNEATVVPYIGTWIETQNHQTLPV